MKNDPRAAYWEDDEAIYVRFEGLDHRRFQQVLLAFKSHVPEAVWFRDLQAWKTPKSKLQAVALFAFVNFGRESLHLRGRAPAQQLKLPF